jgi:hypothetical protein
VTLEDGPGDDAVTVDRGQDETPIFDQALQRADLFVAAPAVVELPREPTGQLVGEALDRERDALSEQRQEIPGFGRGVF